MFFCKLPYDLKYNIICIEKHDPSLRQSCKEVKCIYDQHLYMCYEHNVNFLYQNMRISRKSKDNYIRLKDLLIYHSRYHYNATLPPLVCAKCKKKRPFDTGLLSCEFCKSEKHLSNIRKKIFVGPISVLCIIVIATTCAKFIRIIKMTRTITVSL